MNIQHDFATQTTTTQNYYQMTSHDTYDETKILSLSHLVFLSISQTAFFCQSMFFPSDVALDSAVRIMGQNKRKEPITDRTEHVSLGE